MADSLVIRLEVPRGSAPCHHSLLPDKEIKEVLMQLIGESYKVHFKISLINIGL